MRSITCFSILKVRALRYIILPLLLLLAAFGTAPAAVGSGDVNQDTFVDATDLVLLAQQLAGNAAPVLAGIFYTGDCDRNGKMAAQDLALLCDLLAGRIPVIWAGGDEWDTDPILGKLYYVPAGTFQQGRGPDDQCDRSDETPFTHTLTQNLAVMETEVAQGMWDALKSADADGFPLANPSYRQGSSLPVEQVTWYEAVLFANRLSVLRGLTPCYYTDSSKATAINASNYFGNDSVYCDFRATGYRLPSEGEWERTARGGTTTPFSVPEPNFISCDSYCSAGNLPGLESVAWFCANSGGQTHPAGQKAANPWGLKDVHGNVWEWCWDWYDTYPSGSATDYHGAGNGSERVLRAGGFDYYANNCRAALRGSLWPAHRYDFFGFRLLRPVN